MLLALFSELTSKVPFQALVSDSELGSKMSTLKRREWIRTFEVGKPFLPPKSKQVTISEADVHSWPQSANDWLLRNRKNGTVVECCLLSHGNYLTGYVSYLVSDQKIML